MPTKTFGTIKTILAKNVANMFSGNGRLYVVNLDKDVLWDLYLDSFPAGTNGIYKERREHDCQHCKQFIRGMGNVVAIRSDNTIQSIWKINNLGSTYQPVFDALNDHVVSLAVTDIFITELKEIGVDFNMAQEEDGTPIKWRHFHSVIPDAHRNKTRKSNESLMGSQRDSKSVLKRTLDTISRDALATVIELIKSDSIYRAGEWLEVLNVLTRIMKQYHKVPEALRDNYCWRVSVEVGPAISRIRNHSIGVLLIDVSEGMDLDKAVKRYENIVAPSNYKRPKPIFTKKMLADAKETVERLGLTRSLRRRFATIDDITVNNVLFADRDSTERMTGDDIFGELESDVPVNPKQFSKATEIHIDKFIADVLPTASKLELLLENRHRGNICSLIAPVHADSAPMFKWGNNFSWAYAGNISDSMKERVKELGGNVNGVLRFSIQWNEDRDNQNDFDAHCVEPNGNRIFFQNKGRVHRSSGKLDVDIINPGNTTAVENIIYTDPKRMDEGVYEFCVNVYSYRGGTSGFRAEIEFDGTIHEFDIANPVHGGEYVPVAKVRYSKKNGFMLMDSDSSKSLNTRDICGLKTNTLHPVSMCLLSPNFWDDKEIGNKHYMFVLKNCVNDECPNGFFNEYLQQELVEHKRVFAALGNKMTVEPSDNQLSGLGFSVSKRDSVVVKVHGHTTRIMKVMI